MATAEKLGGNWIIVRGRDIDTSDEVDGSTSTRESALSSIREFWAGDGWAAQYGLAEHFATQEDAEAYLAAHQEEMD